MLKRLYQPQTSSVTRMCTWLTLSLLFASSVYGQNRDQDPLVGLWKGQYVCDGIAHPVLLKLWQTTDGSRNGEVHVLYDGEDYFSYELTGIDAKNTNTQFAFRSGGWIQRPTLNIGRVDFEGRLSGVRIQGDIGQNGCDTFSAVKQKCRLDRNSGCSRAVRGRFARFLSRTGQLRPRQIGAQNLGGMALGAIPRIPNVIVPPRGRAPRVDGRIAPPIDAVVMKKDAFDALLKRVGAPAFDDERLPFIALVAETNWFSTAQITSILKKFRFDEGRLKALPMLVKSLLHSGDAFLILDSFTFASNRQKATVIMAETLKR